MTAIEELLKLAEDCYAQAKITTSLTVKAELMAMGDRYVETAAAMQRERPVVARMDLSKPGK